MRGRATRGPVRVDCQHLVLLVLGIIVLRPLLRFTCRARVRRSGPIPLHGTVFASNHRSFFDPPLASLWLDRPVCYFARADLWRIPIIRQFLLLYRGLPIDRHEPQAAVMRRAVEHLRAGRNVLVFPEGTRTRTGRLGRMREGAALFARRSGGVVVPVYLHRSEDVWPRGRLLPRLWGTRIEVRFGPPLHPDPLLPPRDQDADVSRRLERWMHEQERALLGPPGRGG